MSIEKPNVSYGNGYVLSDYSSEHIVGKILTLIEAMGLPQRQEEATKGLIKQAVYEVFADGVYIGPELHTQLREAYEKGKIEAVKLGNVPMSAINKI